MVLSLLLAACQKIDFDNSSTGEGIETGSFRITSPVSSSSIALNAATPSTPLVMAWTAAKPGVDKAITYKWIAVKKGEDISKYTFELPSDNDGKATTLTITHEKLDLYLFSKGIPANGTVDLTWTIQASNGETQVNSTDQFSLTLKRFGDGATPFILYGPEPIITTATVDPTSTTNFFQFKWQKSVPATGSPAVKYRVLFDKEGGDFSDPIFSIESNNSGSDSSLQVSYKRLSDSLNANGYEDMSLENRLVWTVQAVSGNWTQLASVTNALNLLREVRMYVVGGLNDWNINNPVQIIPDKGPGRYAKIFYAYVLFNKGDEFKFINAPGDWKNSYGVVGGSNGTYDLQLDKSANIVIADSGVYRITIDVSSNKAYVQKKAPGTVGDFQSPSWDPANLNPGVYVAPNKFMSIVSGNGPFKFHDGTNWDNSGPDKSRWWGQHKIAAQGILDEDMGGDNITASGAPIRALWDASDPQKPKYQTFPATLFLIGDATAGDWNNNSPDLPALTYQGNGKWKGTNIPLTGGKEFKFLLVKNSWDYNFGGVKSNASENKFSGGQIKPNGGNVKVLTTGNYTVELDEFNSTYKVY